LKRDGLSGALKHSALRLWELFYLKRELLEFSGDMHKEQWYIEGRDPQAHTPLVDVEIRRATRDDLPRFSRILSKKRLRKFEEWFDKGYDAFVALSAGEIVYYQWLAFRDFYHPWIEMEFKIGENEVYPVDVYAVPGYRMKNLHLAVDSMLFRYCRDRNRYRLVATASPDKFRLFQLMYKRGGLGTVHPVRSITYLRIMGFKKHRIRELTPC